MYEVRESIRRYDATKDHVHLYGDDCIRCKLIAVVGRPKNYIELEAEDVGKFLIHAFGREWRVADFMGRILRRDIGKRVYLVGEILQVENDEQRANRLAEAQT
jgi:hypothetical protein